jgi:hypothetical protein
MTVTAQQKDKYQDHIIYHLTVQAVSDLRNT